MAFTSRIGTGPSGNIGAVAIAVPTGFDWTPSWSIFQTKPGEFKTNIVESALRVATADAALYVDIATGVNTNAGTDPLLPRKSIWHAINTGGNRTIYVKSGVYGHADSWVNLTPVANCNVIGVTDFTTLAPGRVVSNVNAGTINGKLSLNTSLCVENFTFNLGFGRNFLMQNGSATFINCDFVSSDTLEGLVLSSNAAGVTHTVTLIRCRAINAAGDGFGSTTLAAGEIVNWAEIDCISYRGGRAGAGTHQGSSIHKTAGNGAINVIRINGHYYDSYGPQNIADVGGVESWNLGVHAYRTDSGGNTSFYCGDSGTMWLHSCVADGAIPFQTDNAGGTIKVYDTPGSHTGTGTFTTYNGITGV